MSLVRPAARAALWRWREVLVGAGVLALGLWWMLGAGGLLGWIGAATLLSGAALIVAGVQRARFRTASGGPGVVQVDEGRIAYFGPLNGGAVALSELSALTLDRRGTPHWVLSQPGQPDLCIPLNAEGAEVLFDVFASLPGLRTERMLSELARRADHPVPIWRRPQTGETRLARPH